MMVGVRFDARERASRSYEQAGMTEKPKYDREEHERPLARRIEVPPANVETEHG